MIQLKMDQAVTLTLLSLFQFNGAFGCQLSSLEIKERPHFLSRNFTNILVSWKSDGCDELTKVKIIIEHQQFLGCQNFRRNFNLIEKTVEDSGLVIMENLFHFSNYSIKICAIDNCISQNFSTRESVPRVRVQVSPVRYDYKDSETQLSFNWRPPLASHCDKFQ